MCISLTLQAKCLFFSFRFKGDYVVVVKGEDRGVLVEGEDKNKNMIKIRSIE